MGIKIGFRVFQHNGQRALLPATALDEEEMAKLDPDAIYQTEFTKLRNYMFHRRFFAMLGVILDNMDATVREEKGITTIETLLLRVKLELGHCDYIWLDQYQQFCITPKSISFASMDEHDFRKFYSDTLDLAIANYFPGGTEGAQSWRDMVNDAVYKLVGFF